MKKFCVSTAFILLLAAASITTAYGGPKQEALGKATLRIEGMTSPCCVPYLESILLGVKGVKKVSVSLENAEAMVEFEAGKVTVDQLVDTIKEAGYRASIKEMSKKYVMPEELKKEMKKKFNELGKEYNIPETDLEEHWNFVRKEAEQVFERCCEWALSRGMKMEDAESYCKSAILAAIGEYYPSR